ncbi:MAG: hypothetical protein SNI45_02305 [Rikenellaceae bacterium]
MIRSYKLLTLFAALSFSAASFAQEAETEIETETEDKKVDLTPQIFGSVRAKYEESTEADLHRFNVRNSRLGVKGMTSENMRYSMQIDFNNEGKVSILDSYVTLMDGNFELTLGQQQYHFNADLDRGPSSSLFSNRSFLAKYLTTYYSDSSVSTIGSRDIGALASYKFNTKIPVAIIMGLMNGSGANNPEWCGTVNYTGRLAVGGNMGLQAATSYYYGYTPLAQKIEMYGAEMRYASADYLVEAAFAQRLLEQDGTQCLTAAHIHGYRTFHLPKNSRFSYLAPHLRYDIGNGIEFENQVSGLVDRYDAQRVTIALNIGFAEKWIGSEIRIAYEEYIVGTSHTDAAVNPLLQDKYTIEFIASF